MNPPRIIACYVRTPNYQPDALTHQIRVTRRFLRTQLGVQSSVIYCDDGHSGNTLERPGLTALLAHIETGGIEAVVVTEYQRLSKIHTHLLTVQTKLEKANVSLWVADPLPRDYAEVLRDVAPHSFFFDAPIPEGRP